MTLIDRYRRKENYQIEHNLSWWRGHLDTVVVGEHAKYMGDRVLDIGCGDGGLTKIMAERFGAVVGIDVNRKIVESARRRFERDRPTNVHFICCMANDIPFADGFFDGAFCLQMMEHLFKEDIKPTLKEMSRVVKKGGYVVAAVPRAGDETDAYMKIRAYDPAHISYFHIEEEVRKFFGNIFKIVSVKHETRPNPGRPNDKPHNSWVILLRNKGGGT